jgi:hypothetical protein
MVPKIFHTALRRSSLKTVRSWEGSWEKLALATEGAAD